MTDNDEQQFGVVAGISETEVVIELVDRSFELALSDVADIVGEDVASSLRVGDGVALLVDADEALVEAVADRVVRIDEASIGADEITFIAANGDRATMPTGGEALTADEFNALNAIEQLAVLDINANKVFWRSEVGDFASWRTTRRKKLREERFDEFGPRAFVNPYTFVPLDGAPQKGPPVGHDLLGTDRFSGSIGVRWRTETPLLCGAAQRPTDTAAAAAVATGATAAGVSTFASNSAGLVVPGSSIKGAVRSLHEALVNGCMRVFDADFMPVYREHASPSHRMNFVIGIVEEVDKGTGRPTKVRLVERVVWTKAQDLVTARQQADLDPVIESGQSFTIDGNPVRLGDREHYDNATVTAHDGPAGQGQHTILVADTNSARDGRTFWCAGGVLGETVLGVSGPGWSAFLETVAGADDVEDERQPVDFDHYGNGFSFNGRSLGPGRRLATGQVVWVRVTGESIDRISLSALWRSKGKFNAGQRARNHLPCQHRKQLCTSCRIFGSAETKPETSENRLGAEQNSYRSHIRFGDGVLRTGDRATTVEDLERAVPLAPMLSPRPGAGQFYLNNKNRQRTTQGKAPGRQWGSDRDGNPPRSIRGRKFYWHGDPIKQKTDKPQLRGARHHARGENADVSKIADLAKPDTEIDATIRFDGLSTEELGSLLLAIDPTLHFGAHVRTRLGGGKPMGLGTVAPTITSFVAQSAARRYCGTETPTPSPTDFVQTFVQRATDAATVTERWPDIAAVLTPEHVPAALVWYPPGANWDRANTDGFDESFKFFGDTDGSFRRIDGDRQLPDHTQQLVPLEDPRELEQLLPIAPNQEPNTWWRNRP